jgi:hypothetical protein
LALLEAGELGGASLAENEAVLARGQEYLDLDRLDVGVQRASGAAVPLRHVLPRKAVHEDTWRRILRQLTTS